MVPLSGVHLKYLAAPRKPGNFGVSELQPQHEQPRQETDRLNRGKTESEVTPRNRASAAVTWSQCPTQSSMSKTMRNYLEECPTQSSMSKTMRNYLEADMREAVSVFVTDSSLDEVLMFAERYDAFQGKRRHDISKAFWAQRTHLLTKMMTELSS